MAINSNVEHTIWRGYSDKNIIWIRCGYIEVPLEKKPNYCPVCGENVEESKFRNDD